MSENTQTVETVETVETEEFLPMVDVDHDFQLPTQEEPETVPTSIEEIVTALVNGIDGAMIKPYGIHTVINTTFQVLGSELTVRPQMMYNYDRNGLIVKGKKGTKEYTKTEVIAFATKYVTKKTK